MPRVRDRELFEDDEYRHDEHRRESRKQSQHYSFRDFPNKSSRTSRKHKRDRVWLDDSHDL